MEILSFLECLKCGTNIHTYFAVVSITSSFLFVCLFVTLFFLFVFYLREHLPPLVSFRHPQWAPKERCSQQQLVILLTSQLKKANSTCTSQKLILFDGDDIDFQFLWKPFPISVKIHRRPSKKGLEFQWYCRLARKESLHLLNPSWSHL